jgi:hypothetical protein
MGAAVNELLTVLFMNKTDQSPLLPGLDFRVDRLAWSAQGGPQQAELSAEIDCLTPHGQLSGELFELLGCGAAIFDEAAQPVWWGQVGRIEVATVVDLDWLTNRVAVQYWQRQPELEWQGEKTFTAWADNPHSMAQFGVKERIYFLNSLLEDQAEAARDAWLEALSQPEQKVGSLCASQAISAERFRVRMICRGWWQTIGWRYAQLFNGYEGFVRGTLINQMLGRSANVDALIAQSFQTTYGPWECGEVVVKFRMFGLCTDGVQAALCADSGGKPDHTAPLAVAAVPASAVVGGLRWVRFVLPAPVLIQPNTPCWLVLQRTGALSSANYYQLMRDDTDAYPSGQLMYWNGSSWISSGNGLADINFYLVGYKPRLERLIELVAADLGGQFLSGVRLHAAPEGYTFLWRDGVRTCLEDLRDLLLAGDAGGRRLLAEVCADRSLLVRAMPDEDDAEYSIGLDGVIRGLLGGEASLALPIAGRRAVFAPGWLDRSVMIWRVEWTPDGGLRAEVEEE